MSETKDRPDPWAAPSGSAQVPDADRDGEADTSAGDPPASRPVRRWRDLAGWAQVLTVLGLVSSFVALVLAVTAAAQIGKFERIFDDLGIELPPLSAALVAMGPLGPALIGVGLGLWPIICIVAKRGWHPGLAAVLGFNTVLVLGYAAVITIGLFQPLIVIIEKLGE